MGLGSGRPSRSNTSRSGQLGSRVQGPGSRVQYGDQRSRVEGRRSARQTPYNTSRSGELGSGVWGLGAEG
eukprot:1530461-Rhodomonas_salina.2